MSQAITLALVLAALQVVALRVGQHLLPALYFTTSSLFDRRSEVRGGATLFRAAIPFSTGMLVPLLISHDERAVAAAAGSIAWFLVLWPIIWSPALLFPHSKAWPIVGLLLFSWVGFAVLPVAGVLATETIRAENEWWHGSVQAAVLAVPITVVTLGLGRLAQGRVTFADDQLPEEGSELEPDEAYVPSLRERIDSASYAVPQGAVALGTLLILLWLVVRGRRDGRP